MSSLVRTPPPTVSGMKQREAVRSTISKIVSRFSWLAVISRKHNSSAPAAIVGGGRLHGIARVDQIDEVDALDDAPVLDVEAGNDADLEHGTFCLPSVRPATTNDKGVHDCGDKPARGLVAGSVVQAFWSSSICSGAGW